MTSELTSFAARLREFIADAATPLLGGSRQEEFGTLALELFAHQYAHNRAYRPLCEARGVTPATVGHWSQIPAVPAAAFKELELTCLAPAERTTVFHSSGTTGQQPSRHFHSADSLQLYEAALWRWFQPHVLSGLKQSQWQLLILTPPPVAAPNSSLVHMFETVRQRSGIAEAVFTGSIAKDNAWTVDVARAEATLRRSINARVPLALLGTAFNFVHLLDALAVRDLRLQLPEGSRIMETGGYKGRSRELSKPRLHQLIEDRFGVPRSHIICEYGMSELSSQAYDGIAGRPHNLHTSNRIFHFPPWCRAQIISPETGGEVEDGGTGMIRVFDLANAYSVMAIQTEDLAIRREDGFELIGRSVASEPRGCSLMHA